MNLVFCIPGRNFSREWVLAWSELLHFCKTNNINYYISMFYSPNIYMARNGCLGANVLRGINQKPFDGKLKYDKQVWIDSDVIVRPDQLKRLISHDLDIISGIYKMENSEYATVETMDIKFFKQYGQFKFLDENRLKQLKKNTILEVDYTGFGFLAIKYGVIERLEYPWFQPIFYKIYDITDYSMDDVGCLQRLKELGIKTFIDPEIKVGHQKSNILL